MRRSSGWSGGRALAGVLAFALSVGAAGAPEQAKSADRFVDSIGVCTHWSYPDTPYGFAYAQVKQKLVESGIRTTGTA